MYHRGINVTRQQRAEARPQRPRCLFCGLCAGECSLLPSYGNALCSGCHGLALNIFAEQQESETPPPAKRRLRVSCLFCRTEETASLAVATPWATLCEPCAGRGQGVPDARQRAKILKEHAPDLDRAREHAIATTKRRPVVVRRLVTDVLDSLGKRSRRNGSAG